MKVRHVLFSLVIVLAAGTMLVSCELLGFVSIDQRMAHFQDDLNSTDRVSVYQDFHPDQTQDYNALKDPTTTIDTVIPRASGYSLYISSESDTSAVMVTISGPGLGAPHYLKLNMATTGIGDWRIVTLEISTTGTFTGTPNIQ